MNKILGWIGKVLVTIAILTGVTIVCYKSTPPAQDLKRQANNRVVTDCALEKNKTACDYIQAVQSESRRLQ